MGVERISPPVTGGSMSSDYTLSYGTHARPEDGRCAMEWVSHLAGEPHSDEPACVSPVLRAMCIALNDGLEHEPRQRLRPYLARTIGTADDGLDTERGWMAMDWLIPVYTPAWVPPPAQSAPPWVRARTASRCAARSAFWMRRGARPGRPGPACSASPIPPAGR